MDRVDERGRRQEKSACDEGPTLEGGVPPRSAENGLALSAVDGAETSAAAPGSIRREGAATLLENPFVNREAKMEESEKVASGTTAWDVSEDLALWTWLKERLRLCYASLLQQCPPGKVSSLSPDPIDKASVEGEHEGRTGLPSFLSCPVSSFFVAASSPFQMPLATRVAWTEQANTQKSLAERASVAEAAVPPEVTLRWLCSLPEGRRRKIFEVLRTMKEEEEAALWGRESDEGDSASEAEEARGSPHTAAGGERPGVAVQGDASRERAARGDRPCTSECTFEPSSTERQETQTASRPTGACREETARRPSPLTDAKEPTQPAEACETAESHSLRPRANLSPSGAALSSPSFFLFPPAPNASLPGVPPSVPAWSADCAFLPGRARGTWPGAAGVWEQAGVTPAFQLGELVMHSWRGRFQLAVVLERRIFHDRRRVKAGDAAASQRNALLTANEALISPVALREEERRQRRAKRGGKGDDGPSGDEGEARTKRPRRDFASDPSSGEDESESSEDDTFVAGPHGLGAEAEAVSSAALAGSAAPPVFPSPKKRFEVIYRVVCLGYNKTATKKSFGEWTRESHLMVVDCVEVLRKCHAHNVRAIRDVKDAGFNAWQVQEALSQRSLASLSGGASGKNPGDSGRERQACGGRGAWKTRGRLSRGRATGSSQGPPDEREETRGESGRATSRARGRGGRRKTRGQSEALSEDSESCRDGSGRRDREDAPSKNAHKFPASCRDRERDRQVTVESLRRKLLDDMEQLKQAEEHRRQEEATTGKERIDAHNSIAVEQELEQRQPVAVHQLWKLPRWLFARLNQNRSLVLLRSFPLMPHELRAAREDRSAGRRSFAQESTDSRLVGEMTVAELQARFERALLAFIREKRRLEEDEMRSREGPGSGSVRTAVPASGTEDSLSVVSASCSLHASLGSGSSCPSSWSSLSHSCEPDAEASLCLPASDLASDSSLPREGNASMAPLGEDLSCNVERGRKKEGVQAVAANPAHRQRQSECTESEESVCRSSGDLKAAFVSTADLQPGTSHTYENGQARDATATCVDASAAVGQKSGDETGGGRGVCAASFTSSSPGPTMGPGATVFSSRPPPSTLASAQAASSEAASAGSHPCKIDLERIQCPELSSFGSSSSSASSFSPRPAIRGDGGHSGVPCPSASPSPVPPSDCPSSVNTPSVQSPWPAAPSSSSVRPSALPSASPLPPCSPTAPSCDGAALQSPVLSAPSWDREVELECEFFTSYFGHISAAEAEALWGPLTSLVAIQVDWLNSHFLTLACHTEEEAADLRDHQRRQQSLCLSEIVGLEHWARCLHPATMAKHHVKPVLERLPLPLQSQFVRLTQLIVHYLTHMWRRKIEEGNRKGMKGNKPQACAG
ncbi:conserved hypothetical protein [Neospora caninum Liverpool]|uniref:Uncharacterized protein n=1 Tax=Neospora caninum (strain Liverpool) TaxID=572307 RepID=F0VGD8_NEOCL|nr:conserved hypothetical protein [Neospora caninum Liverpool]CBZ52782.1 conserved hypothetical protein [Neospora caninum Liverpool]CEL66764.1 TPA: hypothetical protein BN1204_025700 [Neospora caninum Liverpool]|eukprot:XP_003882814.1 conserved hypothetical protein [Neospora caninum Liverpool]